MALPLSVAPSPTVTGRSITPQPIVIGRTRLVHSWWRSPVVTDAAAHEAWGAGAGHFGLARLERAAGAVGVRSRVSPSVEVHGSRVDVEDGEVEEAVARQGAHAVEPLVGTGPVEDRPFADGVKGGEVEGDPGE